jgi:hypothetical protein
MGDMMLNASDRSLGLDACRSHNIRMHISSKNKSYFLLTRQSVDLLIVMPTRLRRLQDRQYEDHEKEHDCKNNYIVFFK